MDKKTRNVVALKKIFDAFQNATDAQVGGWGVQRRLRPGVTTPLVTAAAPATPYPLQRTFREIMFLQELNNHENIVR